MKPQQLRDVPQREMEDWIFHVITTQDLAESEWDLLGAIDVRYQALALNANPALREQLWPELQRKGDYEVMFWATVLDGDNATIKLIVHEEVQAAYDKEGMP
jgi:hypothetical protein